MMPKIWTAPPLNSDSEWPRFTLPSIANIISDLRKIVRELEETHGDTREASRLLKNRLKSEASDVAEVERLTAELAKLQK
jgi:hypothetical protein